MPVSTPCFAAGTLVVTGIDSAGQLTTKNIEDVQVGDWVLARSQNDPADSLEQRQVTAVEVHTVTSLRLLDIQEADGTTETIRTTDEHPFWVSDVGWVKAGDLQVGQQLVTSAGQVATLTATRAEPHPEGITVYNFTVDQDHTYFVTDVADDEAVWVHNAMMDTVNNPFAPTKPSVPTKPAVPSRDHLYDPTTDFGPLPLPDKDRILQDIEDHEFEKYWHDKLAQERNDTGTQLVFRGRPGTPVVWGDGGHPDKIQN